MTEPTPPVPVLPYGRPDLSAPVQMRRAIAIVVPGFIVAIAAVLFNWLLLVATSDGLMSASVRRTGFVASIAIAGSTVFDLALAVTLCVPCVQLLRRRSTAIPWLRWWSVACLVGVGCFVAASVGYILDRLPPGSAWGDHPELLLPLVPGVIGCAYPLAVLAITRRRAGL